MNDNEIEKTANELFSQEAVVKDEHLAFATKIIASITVDIDLLEQESNQSDPVDTDRIIEKTLINSDKNNDDIRNILLKATLPQKIKLALLGNATCRALLIRDSNKMIQQLVLRNPRLQPSEVEEFAKNPNLSEMVLRNIAENTQWMRSYSLKVSIVFNPKSPHAQSLRWLKFLNTADLRKLAKSKNVPNVLSVSARKKLAESHS